MKRVKRHFHSLIPTIITLYLEILCVIDCSQCVPPPSHFIQSLSDKQPFPHSGETWTSVEDTQNQCQHAVSAGREVLERHDPAALIYEFRCWNGASWSWSFLGKLVHMIESCQLRADRGGDEPLNTRSKLCLVFSVGSPQHYNAVFPCSPRPLRLFSDVATGR